MGEPVPTWQDVLAGRADACLIQGDCAKVLADLPSASFHAVVTDPPAGIGFMGLAFDHHRGGRAQWVKWLSGILALARAATVPGGRAFVWALPRTTHWTGCAVEDAGWAVENVVTHLFGTGWPKGASQLKPASEHWYLARTGPSTPLNVDACRVLGGPSVGGSIRYTALGRMNDDGWQPKPCDIDRTMKAGRWPPNSVLSHSLVCTHEGPRKVVTGSGGPIVPSHRHGPVYGADTRSDGLPHINHRRPDGTEMAELYRCVAGCPASLLAEQSGQRRTEGHINPTNQPVGYMGGAVRNVVPVDHHDTGTAARYFPQFEADEGVFLYTSKAPTSEREAGLREAGLREAECRTGIGGSMPIDDDGNERDRSVKIARNIHPTVKSVALMRWLIRLITKPGDVVLDPFAGSGTTLVAAVLEGRRAVGIELDPVYVEIARARVAYAIAERRAEERRRVENHKAATAWLAALPEAVAAPTKSIVSEGVATLTWKGPNRVFKATIDGAGGYTWEAKVLDMGGASKGLGKGTTIDPVVIDFLRAIHAPLSDTVPRPAGQGSLFGGGDE